MPQETFDDLEWDISEMPIGSSTPDEFVEFSYNATAICPNCGKKIEGTAQYWSDKIGRTWLERVDYEPCTGYDENDEFI
jgi:hypothetical protein